MLKEEIVKSCSGVSMTIGKHAFLFFSGKLLSRRPDDRQGGVEGKERNQSCLVKRFDGNSSVGKSKGSRIDDGRKLFLICVSRVAVSVVKRIPSRLLFFFFFRGTFERLSSLGEPILRGHSFRTDLLGILFEFIARSSCSLD